MVLKIVCERFGVTRGRAVELLGEYMELAEYLETEDITLAEFGRMVGGVEESTVARWRAGLIFPSPANMERIEQASFGVVTYRDFQKTRARIA